MNLAACAALPRRPENTTWYRLVEPHYLGAPLASAHTKVNVSRFNPGRFQPPADQFEILYLSDSPIVGQFEVGAVLGSLPLGDHIPHPRKSYVSLSVDVALYDVADLTNVAAAQLPLATTAQELTGDWYGYGTRSPRTPVTQPVGLAPTQELGRELFRQKFEGFRSISAKYPEHRVLVVFPENLRGTSALTITDSSGTTIHKIP